MKASETLKRARTEARLSQRRLAVRSGVPQSAIARIESGRVIPRIDTLDRLLRACGVSLETRPIPPGYGVDRTLIHEMLRLTPAERIEYGATAARNLQSLRANMRRIR